MGLLEGRNALIFGVANDHSIAWGIARALHDEGAEVGFSSVESLIERRVRPLAASIGSTFVEPCDVQSDDQIRTVFERWGATHESLDILVHALAFARREDLEGGFIGTTREGFALALDVSAYSLVALAREARPLLHRGSSMGKVSHDLPRCNPNCIISPTQSTRCAPGSRKAPRLRGFGWERERRDLNPRPPA